MSAFLMATYFRRDDRRGDPDIHRPHASALGAVIDLSAIPGARWTSTPPGASETRSPSSSPRWWPPAACRS
ncbi:MAG: hypothetical protein MZV64_29575 [Ignavibacteriales bacterium]|nr:hypothetical protein [Ignavibacteriales bacterium]